MSIKEQMATAAAVIAELDIRDHEIVCCSCYSEFTYMHLEPAGLMRVAPLLGVTQDLISVREPEGSKQITFTTRGIEWVAIFNESEEAAWVEATGLNAEPTPDPYLSLL